jgi:signal transduction histidine kinase
MINTLRSKLTMGFLPLVVILIGLGLWAIVMFYRLGGNIDVILRENYRSVLAVERMKEALERMDSAMAFRIYVSDTRSRPQFEANKLEFDRQLAFEQSNITVLGEGELVEKLTKGYQEYLTLARAYFSLPRDSPAERGDYYFSKLLPKFDEIKGLENQILLLNQRNMEEMNETALRNAANSTRLMIGALLVAVALAFAAQRVLSRMILEPIMLVTSAARAVSMGNLNQVVPATTNDELGELAQTFNTMARTIREFREAGTVRLLRAQKTTQATIDAFPDPVVVVDPAGAVERANPAAQRLLQASPPADGGVTPWTAPTALRPHLEAVLNGQGDYLPLSLDQAIFLRDSNQDRYFLPRVLRIRADSGELLGAAVSLLDVTKFQLVDQLKNDMISTVSHELKTPLTSLQMAVHLLLEEAVGPLTPKQVELLLTARQDADRLLAMINDLLDLTRIEQGKVALDIQPQRPADLVSGAVDRFEAQATDAGIELRSELGGELPPVLVDRERVEHVFDNLLSNALRHTGRGGRITLRAFPRSDEVAFEVEDTGEGIPEESLPRIFDRFFRVPGSKRAGGAGLGLAIAREILAAHGGHIDVRSRLGDGTTFTFTLPAGREPGTDSVPRAARRGVHAAS